MPLRHLLKAALAALAGLTLIGPAAAQDEPPPPPSPIPRLFAGESTPPKAPIPYTQLHRAPSKPQPKPKPATTPAAQPPAPGQAPFIALAASTPMPPQQLEAFVDGVVREAMARDHIAGVIVSVVQNGQVVMKKGYGVSRLNPAQPVDPDRTLFRIGSISKTFTWIALMKEIEIGHMRLDAPVNLYLPQSLQVPDQGFDQPVRLRHLLTHTAGFEDRALGQLFEQDYNRVRPLQVYLRQERPQRVRGAGAEESYSNYGAALAGMAVSNVTGKTFEALVKDEIINPLHLTRTTFREPHPAKAGLPHPMDPALARDVAQGFRWTANGFERRPFEYVGQIAPAASASSTAGDMARYMQTLLNGGALDGATVFSPQIARWMRTSLYRPAPGATGWNYGFEELALPGGHKGFGHQGSTLSFMSSMVLAPDLGLGIFVSTNTDTGTQLRDRLPQQIIEHFYAPATAAIPPGSPSLVNDAAVYEGHYLTTRRAYGGMEGFVDALIGFTNVRVTPGGYLSTTDNEGVHLWAPTGKPGVFRSLDGPETIVFDIRDARATRIFGASGTAAYERRGDWAGPNLLALLAGLTAIAAITTLIGVGFRSRRDFRQTTVQARASLMQTTQAVLWLVAMGCFATWASRTADTARVVYDWPGPWIVIASACALVAAVLTIMTLIMLPVIWRGGRRVDSWTGGRKLRFTMTVLVFSAFALDLAYWGALMPWSG